MAKYRKKIVNILFFTLIFLLLGIINALAQESSREAVLASGVDYQADNLKDPFTANIQEKIISTEIGTGPELNIGSVVVQGLVWGGAFPQAIINGKIVKAGDTLDQIKIVNISKQGISVLYENKEYVLSSPSVVAIKSMEQNKMSQEAIK